MCIRDRFSPVPSDGREAVDRKSLMLPDEDLVKLVLKANPNTILVLVSSFPYTINWSQEHVPALSLIHIFIIVWKLMACVLSASPEPCLLIRYTSVP